MTTPTAAPKCSLNISYCKYGAETVLKLLDGFEDLIDGVIENTDVECVHKTRVRSRRLRAALPLFEFCYPGKEFKRWSKELKKVTKLLSQARDLDVQIAFIEGYIKNLGPDDDKSCIKKIAQQHKTDRKKMQADVEDGLKKLKTEKTLPAIKTHCRQIISQQSNQEFDSGQVLEKAHRHIMDKLDNFLSMKQYVYQENEKLKLHQMRICAKKLRYTMECFTELYMQTLKGEIETMKAFQDTLGEMHDCDVWLDFIPQFKEQIQEGKAKPTQTQEQSLQKFTAYIEGRRKKNYTQFVQHWEQCVKDEFFEQLVKKTNLSMINAIQVKIEQLLGKRHLKMAVISDVHANFEALESVLEDAKSQGADVVVNAGDSIGFGACPNQVLEQLCKNNVLSIVGNYDVEVLEGKSDAKGEKKIAFKYATKELSKPSECYLQLLPHELRLEIRGKRLLVTHGSPESIEEHIYHNTPAERLGELAATANADVVIIGHSHEQFHLEANGTHFINPGSVGRPSDGNPQAAYALISFEPFKVDLLRVDYDVKGAAYALRKKGLPECFAQMLLEGVALDGVAKHDAAKELIVAKSCNIAVDASRRFSDMLLADSEHYEQVKNLALALFDGLAGVHKLGRRERCWLECASLLHDIGLVEGTRGHHKASMSLILNDTELPLPSQDRRVIASIARYHRRAPPKANHYNLASLSPATVKCIRVLSAILRVADSLDYTHKSNVKVLALHVDPKKITLECIAKDDLALERSAFDKKKDLFEKTFGRKAMLVCKPQ